MDVVLTGASRGIGRALALALPSHVRVHAVARDSGALASLERERPNTATYVADLASLSEAARIGEVLAHSVHSATLVHGAGLWPAKRELVTAHGATFERAFVVNGLAPLAVQRALIERRRVARILLLGAGIMVKGRFSAKTPQGEDFHWLRTYASTKLFGAVAMRMVSRAHPELDVAVVHPGVVRTELGARGGVVGWLLSRIKRSWEAPEVTAQRLLRLLARERWSRGGEAAWYFEDGEQPFPELACDPALEQTVRSIVPAGLLTKAEVE